MVFLKHFFPLISVYHTFCFSGINNSLIPLNHYSRPLAYIRRYEKNSNFLDYQMHLSCLTLIYLWLADWLTNIRKILGHHHVKAKTAMLCHIHGLYLKCSSCECVKLVPPCGNVPNRWHSGWTQDILRNLQTWWFLEFFTGLPRSTIVLFYANSFNSINQLKWDKVLT